MGGQTPPIRFNPLRCCMQHLVPLRHGDNILRGFEIPPARSEWTLQTATWAGWPRPYGCSSLLKKRDSFCYSWNPPTKSNVKKKSGMVLSNSACQFQLRNKNKSVWACAPYDAGSAWSEFFCSRDWNVKTRTAREFALQIDNAASI